MRCVHCGAMVEVVPAADARFLCGRCGGIRIPMDGHEGQRSKEQIEFLRRASVARNAKITWATIAAVVAGFGAFSALVLALVASVADPGTGPVAAGVLSVLATWAFAGYAWQSARRQDALFRQRLDDAWMAAAADLRRAHGGDLDAARLARSTRIDTALAERLLRRPAEASARPSPERAAK
jgi:hypothetical protein